MYVHIETNIQGDLFKTLLYNTLLEKCIYNNMISYISFVEK